MSASESIPDTLTALIHDIRFAMLTTRSPDGSLSCRPMMTQDDDGDGFLWFFAGSTTHKASDILANPEVNLSYSDLGSQRYISVSGRATMIIDRAQMLTRWRPGYAAWIPLGIDDPDMALLKVVISHVEFWRPPSTWTGQALACGTHTATRDHAEGRHTS